MWLARSLTSPGNPPALPSVCSEGLHSKRQRFCKGPTALLSVQQPGRLLYVLPTVKKHSKKVNQDAGG